MVRVGLIVGNGTGRELAEIFRRTVTRIAKLLNKEVEVVDCEREFKSYHHLQKSTPSEIEQIVNDDLEELTAFYKDFYATGGRAVFRTALNAETLYRFRALGKAVKTVYIPLAEKKLLFVRDEIQGFYANESTEIDDRTIRFSGSFSLDNFEILAQHSLGEAQRFLDHDHDVWVVYKHHLFANVIENWAKSVFPRPMVYQPNHATEILDHYLNSGPNRDLLLVAGNEVGDILHEVLIYKLNLGTRNTLCSSNIYKHPDLEGLVEYQTVHGSADNLEGRGLVNPLATMRAAATFIEAQLEEANFVRIMDEAIRDADELGALEAGGQNSTAAIAESVLSRLTHRLQD